jgi:hypothetical protein
VIDYDFLYKKWRENGAEIVNLTEERDALRAELTVVREALEKIAARNVPFPETNMEGYSSMAVVTAREMLARIGKGE